MRSNNNNFDIDNSSLFSLIWTNVFIKRNIQKHLRLFSILKSNLTFTTFDEYDKFQLKEYLGSITINFNSNLTDLSKSIKTIEFNTEKVDINLIPSFIKSINFKNQIQFNQLEPLLSSPNISKLKSIILSLNQSPEIKANQLPNSIKKLSLIHYKHKIKKDVLPNDLKTLHIIEGESIEPNAYPNSLEELIIERTNESFINVLPNNVKKIKYIDGGGSTLKIFQFPQSLIELSITCFGFEALIPSSVKKLSLIICDFNDLILPPSIESLSINFVNSDSNFEILNYNCYKNIKQLINLKSLEIAYDYDLFLNLPNGLECLKLIRNHGTVSGGNPKLEQFQLPQSLKHLEFKSGFFNNDDYLLIEENIFPSSLTYLDFGSSFNQIIGVKVLPLNLKTLILGSNYNQIIDPLALPLQLEHLEIKNPNYNHSINLTNHPNTMVSCHNINIYYKYFNNSPKRLHVLKLSEKYNLPLSTYSLQDKSNLKYLYLYNYNKEIQLSDLPIQNNIKILELDYAFDKTINLEYFKNLEVIKINNGNPKLKTKVDKETGKWNFYNLRSIEIKYPSQNLLKSLHPMFYQFLITK